MTEYGRSDDRKPKKVTQKKKSKLRHSRQWHELKVKLIDERGKIDELTLRQLTKDDKLTCHHMNLTAESYGEFRNTDDYMLLSEMSHKAIHWLWQITKGEDFSILDRIRSVLERMKELTDEDSRTRYVSDPYWRRNDGARQELEHSEDGLADFHDYEEVC